MRYVRCAAGLAAFFISILFADAAAAAPMVQSVTADTMNLVADSQDVQTIRLVVSTTAAQLLDDAQIRINVPLPGRPNSVSYAGGRGEVNFRGYFQWTPTEGFRERGSDTYGIGTVNLLAENPGNPSAGSERIVDAAAGTVTFLFRYTANLSYGNMPDNDVWYYLAESSTGYKSWWRKVETNFSVTSPGYTRPAVASLGLKKSVMLANSQDIQTAMLVVQTGNPALLDTVRLMINFPHTGQVANPSRGYFQWSSRYGFAKVGTDMSFGNHHVRLLPVHPQNPMLGSERIVDAQTGTVTFHFRFVAHASYGDITRNDVWFYLSESGTGYVRPWDTVEMTQFQVITTYVPPTVTVTLHPNSQNSRQFIAGTLNNRLADFAFTVGSSTEPMEIDALTFTQNVTDTASSSFLDYSLLYVTDASGNIVYGSAVPTSTSVFIDLAPGAVLVTSTPVRLQLRADLSAIGPNANVTVGGHMLGYNIAAPQHVQAYGAQFQQPAMVSFGNPLPVGDTHLMYKGIPTVTSQTVSSTLAQGADMFKVRVSAGTGGNDIGLYKFTFDIAMPSTSSLRLTGLDFVDVTDSNNEVLLYSNQTVTQTTNTLLAEIYFDPINPTAPTRQEVIVVPGVARTLVLRGYYSGLLSGDKVSTRLAGDAALVSISSATLMSVASTVDLDTHNDFIWSDRHAALHTTVSNDWTNGYLVSGLPSTLSSARTLTAP